MLTEVENEMIMSQFFDCRWYLPDERPKTMKAVFRVMEKLPSDDRDTLLRGISFIFAPPWSFLGYADNSDTFAEKQVGTDVKQCVVYLAPHLERRRQDYVEATVAHEFAHVVLHHPFGERPRTIEREADEKIKAWGYKPVYKIDGYPDLKR